MLLLDWVDFGAKSDVHLPDLKFLRENKVEFRGDEEPIPCLIGSQEGAELLHSSQVDG